MAKIHRGIVLCELIKSEGVRKVAEIGVDKGKLSHYILKSCGDSLSEYWAVDQWGLLPEYVQVKSSLEKWQKKYQRVAFLMIHFPQLRVIRAKSAEVSRWFPKEYFDLIFINANHSYKSIRQDIKCWLPRVRKGGIVSGHDYGSTKWPDCSRAVDEIFGKENININSDKVWWVKKLKNG